MFRFRSRWIARFSGFKTKAQISCAIITQLICAFDLGKACFLMMWLIFLLEVLLLLLVGKMANNKYWRTVLNQTKVKKNSPPTTVLH